MVIGATTATFCFTANWTGPDEQVSAILRQYSEVVTDSLAAVKSIMG